MSTKTRQTKIHVPAQRQARPGHRPQQTEPAPGPDHRVRNVTLLVSTAVIALGAVVALWFAIFAGGGSPQAPATPAGQNSLSDTGPSIPPFLRQELERPVGPEEPIDGSDMRLFNQAP